HEGLHRDLIAEPIAPRDGVVGVLVEAVSWLDHRRRAALRRDRVAAHRIDLGDHGYAKLRARLDDSDRRAKASASAAYYQPVARQAIHGRLFRKARRTSKGSVRRENYPPDLAPSRVVGHARRALVAGAWATPGRNGLTRCSPSTRAICRRGRLRSSTRRASCSRSCDTRAAIAGTLRR